MGVSDDHAPIAMRFHPSYAGDDQRSNIISDTVRGDRTITNIGEHTYIPLRDRSGAGADRPVRSRFLRIKLR